MRRALKARAKVRGIPSTLLVLTPIVILAGVALVRRSSAAVAATAPRPEDGET